MRRLPILALVVPLLAQAPAPTLTPGGDKAPSLSETWLPRGTADLILLDRLRGQPTPVSVRTGQTVEFGTLSITLRNCATRPPDLPQNAAAFLEITEGKAATPLFRSWILSNTPAVAQLEDPVYDLRLVTCR